MNLTPPASTLAILGSLVVAGVLVDACRQAEPERAPLPPSIASRPAPSLEPVLPQGLIDEYAFHEIFGRAITVGQNELTFTTDEQQALFVHFNAFTNPDVRQFVTAGECFWLRYRSAHLSDFGGIARADCETQKLIPGGVQR